MKELLLILNPSKSGRTAISVQSYTMEFTWEELPYDAALLALVDPSLSSDAATSQEEAPSSSCSRR